MALSVHALLECILGHGKLVTKLLTNPFVNGLRVVYYIITRIFYVSVITEISGTGGRSTTLLATTWRASLGDLQWLILELTQFMV